MDDKGSALADRCKPRRKKMRTEGFFLKVLAGSALIGMLGMVGNERLDAEGVVFSPIRLLAAPVQDHIILFSFFLCLLVLRDPAHYLRSKIRKLVRWALQTAPEDYRFGSIGEDVYFNGNVTVRGAEKVNIGSNVHIGDNAWIHGHGGLFIEDNVHISRNLVLYTANHNFTGTCLPYDHTAIHRPVHIGKNVWIGMNVCIAPGTQIGEGAIIGMGSVISGEVPPLAIVGSQKWRILDYRDKAHYQKLEHREAYGGRNGVPLQGNP
jgi:acetyltransferase-like isoleucine patch superfamily enzyme